MRQPGKVREGAHGELAELVTYFKVSFTADVSDARRTIFQLLKV
ncbi:MAG TPA: hypothetical protein VII09_03140 [Opitutaceae bacterium]